MSRARTSSSRRGSGPHGARERSVEVRGAGSRLALERTQRREHEEHAADERRDRVARAGRRRASARGRRRRAASPASRTRPRRPPRRPSSASIRRTRSCGPTETPPEVTRTSCSRPRSIAARWAASSSATDASGTTSAPAEAEQRRQHRPVRLVDLTRRERIARAAQLRAGREHGDPRPARAVAPRRRPRPPAHRSAQRRAGHRLRTTTAPAATSPPRGRTLAPDRRCLGDLHLPVRRRHALDGHDRIRAFGHDAAGRDRPSPRPRASAPRRGPPRRDAARRPAAGRACRQRARRSRPSPSSGREGGRRARAPPRRAPARTPPRGARARRASGFTRASTAPSASCTDSSSAIRRIRYPP